MCNWATVTANFNANTEAWGTLNYIFQCLPIEALYYSSSLLAQSMCSMTLISQF